MNSLDQAHVPDPHRALIYPDAGHGLGTFPYLPEPSTSGRHPVTGRTEDLGGTRAGNA
jgi:hypothetical protein